MWPGCEQYCDQIDIVGRLSARSTCRKLAAETGIVVEKSLLVEKRFCRNKLVEMQLKVLKM